MQIDGHCHCGALSYTAEIDPQTVIICHCTDCQSISGGPYRANARVKPKDFHLSGTPKTYVKTADSGNAMALVFCGECGTPVYSARVEAPPHYNLRLGSVTQRAQLVPKLQGFCRSAMPWAMDIRDVPKVPEHMHAPVRATK